MTQAGATTLTHHAGNGLLESATVGAVSTTWSRNAFGEIAGSTSAIGASPLLSQSFTRDKLGRIVEKVETVEGATSTYTYSYDVAGRLSEVRRDGVVTATYTYDPNGNRLSYDGTFGAASATFDAQDRLIQYGDNAYTFDAKGDLTSKSANGQSVAYNYTALGGLSGVTLASGVEIDYILDGRGRRVGKKVNGALIQGFLYRDSLRLAAELDPSGAVTSRFVYGSRFNLPDTMEKAGVTYAFLADHLGSPRLVINATSGAIAQRLDYDEFGRVILDTNPGFQPFGFASGLYDYQTGLVRFGARDYDPEVGRWTAKDPTLFQGGSLNLYAYSINDPVNFSDPNGEAAVLVVPAALVAFTVAVIAFEIWLNTPEGQRWLQEAPKELFPLPIVPLLGPRDKAVSPGRGCPKPTAIPGAKEQTTPPPPITPADPEDPKQPKPPGVDEKKEGFWGDLADAVEGIGNFLGGLG